MQCCGSDKQLQANSNLRNASPSRAEDFKIKTGVKQLCDRTFLKLLDLSSQDRRNFQTKMNP